MSQPAEQLFEHAERLVAKAEELAEVALEMEARRYLRQHPELKEFIAAMGAAFFTYHDGGRIEPEDFQHVLARFEAVTGRPSYGPVRFVGADGPRITDW
jgi:glutathione S-transferase